MAETDKEDFDYEAEYKIQSFHDMFTAQFAYFQKPRSEDWIMSFARLFRVAADLDYCIATGNTPDWVSTVTYGEHTNSDPGSVAALRNACCSTVETLREALGPRGKADSRITGPFLTPHETIIEATIKGLSALRVSVMNQWGASRGCQFRYGGPNGAWEWSEDGGETWTENDFDDEYKQHALAAFEHGVALYLSRCWIDSDLFPRFEVEFVENH